MNYQLQPRLLLLLLFLLHLHFLFPHFLHHTQTSIPRRTSVFLLLLLLFPLSLLRLNPLRTKSRKLGTMGDNGGLRPAEKAENRPQSQPQHQPQLQPEQIEMPLSWQFHPNLNFMVNLPFIVSRKQRPPMPSAVISTKRESRWQMSGCSVHQLRGRKPPKFASPKLMKKGLKIPRSGHSTAKSGIGKTKPAANDLREEDLHHRQSYLSRLISLIFCLSVIFAATTITIATHNLHGFKKSSVYHRSCLQRYEGIWLSQETWLTEKQFSLLSSLGSQFVARSSMEDAISTGVFRGRPFGGVSIAWSSKLNGNVNPLTNFRHKRVVGVEVDSDEYKTLIINVYMPFFDASRRDECIVETLDAISMIEMMIDSHPLHSVIIGGDFNCEFNGTSPFDSYWNELRVKFDLISCDRFISDPNAYTYSHDSLGQRKWNDHFLISSRLSNSTTNHSILNEGDNPSDHLPLLFTLSLPVSHVWLPFNLQHAIQNLLSYAGKNSRTINYCNMQTGSRIC